MIQMLRATATRHSSTLPTGIGQLRGNAHFLSGYLQLALQRSQSSVTDVNDVHVCDFSILTLHS